MILGEIRLKDFLNKTNGLVTGRQVSDAKDRHYRAEYSWQETDAGLLIVSKEGSSSETIIPSVIALDESLVSFFGLYSGDGAKGSEAPNNPGLLKPNISFSQRETNLVRFAVRQFKKVFPDARFTFSLGEDSAYFFSGEGLKALVAYYGGKLPAVPPLAVVRPRLNQADIRYLAESRNYQKNITEDLAFYFFHKGAMENILGKKKQQYLDNSGLVLGPQDRVTASLRRPYKKGARMPGGSSRSDEIHVGNVTGMGELFLKIFHEMEASIVEDTTLSPQGLIQWKDNPSKTGVIIDVKQFFEKNPFGMIAGERPTLSVASPTSLLGQWRRSNQVELRPTVRLDPLWCYTAGLYLAEGTSPKYKLFAMYRERPAGLAMGFTSSENTSLELILRTLQQLFPPEKCLDKWKVKVGSQYFPELVVVGIKNGVPMLRGGNSGDGKLRTMEISISIKDWALEIAPSMKPYADRYSHVEPTGAGVPRIDFWASSSLCKWYFPLIMYATFGSIVKDPNTGFAND